MTATAAVTHPRQPPRRGATRPSSWWAKAMVRGIEESSFGESDLRAARTLVRDGAVGALTVDAGSAVASVVKGDEILTATLTLPVLRPTEIEVLVELVAAEAGRIAALLSGDLPHQLVEHAEEAGVELLPYGGEVGGSCSCDSWLDPCPHALAVGYQLSWLADTDPLVLWHVRGLSRESLLAALHARGEQRSASSRPEDPDLDIALEAAERAAALLAELEAPAGG